jgi:hypothetical protein
MSPQEQVLINPSELKTDRRSVQNMARDETLSSNLSGKNTGMGRQRIPNSHLYIMSPDSKTTQLED